MASSHTGRALPGGGRSTGGRQGGTGRGPGGRFPERLARRARLDEHLPVDHRLSTVYRIGAGLMGLVLVAFGILGLIDRIGFFDTGGDTVAGLNTNGALSVLSIVVGFVLFGGMLIGGNVASSLNMWLGAAFLLSGFVNLALLETDVNVLAFRIQNVLFSFVFGLLLMTFGMYGRVSGHLPHDNPYWRARHPGLLAYEEQAALRARGRRLAIQAQHPPPEHQPADIPDTVGPGAGGRGGKTES
ncbi:DUF4383 domain-containing protein [Streptomyces sp. NPDC048639]|uniref:DUF4383 domain-containing protein n=1 Tax=Streptomyces sp. NPDC048639 TaxID=3365581 RepID=UPI003716E318